MFPFITIDNFIEILENLNLDYEIRKGSLFRSEAFLYKTKENILSIWIYEAEKNKRWNDDSSIDLYLHNNNSQVSIDDIKNKLEKLIFERNDCPEYCFKDDSDCSKGIEILKKIINFIDKEIKKW